MPVSSALKRLLRIRDLEQEQHRIALESALSELHALEAALESAEGRERRSRNEFVSAAIDAESAGTAIVRQAALVETEIAHEQGQSLVPRVHAVDAEVARRRTAYLNKRVEQRQAATLIEEAEAAGAQKEGRRNQQFLDDWFGARSGRAEDKVSE